MEEKYLYRIRENVKKKISVLETFLQLRMIGFREPFMLVQSTYNIEAMLQKSKQAR